MIFHLELPDEVRLLKLQWTSHNGGSFFLDLERADRTTAAGLGTTIEEAFAGAMRELGKTPAPRFIGRSTPLPPRKSAVPPRLQGLQLNLGALRIK